MTIFSTGSKRIWIGLAGVLVFLGIVFRLWNITEPNFFFYDEGLYLSHNIEFLYYVQSHPPQNFSQFLKYTEVIARVALMDAKFIWFFISAFRVFFVGPEGWYFTKLVSAVSGIVTLFVVYRFGSVFYRSKAVGWISAATLSLLPGHVFYSRLGLQEAFSALCFTTGMYFYLSSKRYGVRAIVSGFFFSLVFFSNYRMILIPALLILVEVWMWACPGRSPDWRRLTAAVLSFGLIVFGLGNMMGGANSRITFGWMFYQARLAQGAEWQWYNLLSYPYYLFRLESWLFAILFFGGIYFLKRGRREEALPFLIGLFFMAVYSFVEVKGARYLCSALPVVVVGICGLIYRLYTDSGKIWQRYMLVGMFLLMTVWHGVRSFDVSQFSSDYQVSAADIKQRHKSEMFVSSQERIHRLFVDDRKHVMPVPKSVGRLAGMFVAGYRYLVVDPQAYVSLTKDGVKFRDPLHGYLGLVKKAVPPTARYDHFSPALLERFVFEHNVDLMQSIRFLQSNDNGNLGRLYVYDIARCLDTIQHVQKNQAGQ